MPTDHEFNDFGLKDALTNARQELLANSTPLGATIHAELDEAYADALTQGMNAERIEDFRPTGLLNLPDVEVTISSAELVDKYPLWSLTIKRTYGPYLKGVCGCGWQTKDRVRTVTIATEWDEHMLESIPEHHQAVDGGCSQNTRESYRPELRKLDGH